MQGVYKEETPLATEIRRVVNKLKIAQKELGLKTVMITSSSLGEGKSTIASSLAIACSRYRNTKTVLIDFDLRRPRIHELFRQRRRDGIADILQKQKHLKECLKKTRYKNLKILTCGFRLNDVLYLLAPVKYGT